MVVKVADEVEVDVSTKAWKVSYGDAAPGAKQVVVKGVTIPYLGMDALLASKETYREQDSIDRLRLLALKKGQSLILFHTIKLLAGADRYAHRCRAFRSGHILPTCCRYDRRTLKLKAC